ncbi:MAG: Gldg family protein [Bacteroidales bacterium]|nr:Gldg family protein [Bacteroidales bacterium]
MKKSRSLTTYILLIVGLVILINIISERFFFRWDLTADHRYSLSQATKNIVKDLDQMATVTVYFTEDLPAQYSNVRNDIKDLLIEYSNRAHGHLDFEFINPNESEAMEKQAVGEKIQPVVVNVREKDQVKQQRAYMGAVVKVNNEKEVIPLIQSSEGLEYQLSSALKKLSVSDKPKIAFLTGQGEQTQNTMQQVMQQLSVLYDVSAVELTDYCDLRNFKTVMLVAPVDSFSQGAFNALDKYLDNGGNIVIAINRVTGDFSTAQAVGLTTGLEGWLADKGILVEENFVIDQQCGSVGVEENMMGFKVRTNKPFPYFPLSSNFADHPATKGLEQVFFPLVSNIVYEGNDADVVFTSLVKSSAKAGLQTPPLTFEVQRNWTINDFPMKDLTLVASWEKGMSKIVVFGSGNFAVNQQGQQVHPDNVSLFTNAIDWLSDDTGLIELRTKGITARPLDELEDGTKTLLKWLNFLLPIVLVLIYALLQSQKRKFQRMRRMHPRQL